MTANGRKREGGGSVCRKENVQLHKHLKSARKWPGSNAECKIWWGKALTLEDNCIGQGIASEAETE